MRDRRFMAYSMQPNRETLRGMFTEILRKNNMLHLFDEEPTDE